VYSSATLTVDAQTGVIDLASAVAGSHEVTYTIAQDVTTACTNGGSHIATIELLNQVTPVTGFTYAEPSYCIAGANAVPVLATDFYTGGTFSAPMGVTINPTTGEIDIANSTPGNYQVTYTVTAAGCVTGGTTVTPVTITALTPAVLTFSYDTPECLNSGTEVIPEIAENFTFGGTFSSATLTVNAETGIINITNATAGTHEVTYTIATDAATCTGGGTFTASIEFVNGITPVTGFTYNNSYCSDVAVATPELETGFTAGGTFSSTDGLAIDAATGQINVDGSTAGTYEVVYTVEANSATCNTGGISRYSVTILGDLTPVITEDCKENELWLHAAAVNGSFDGADVTYIWKTESGATVGSDNPDFNVSEYYAANAGLQLPFGITVTVASGTCSGEAGYTVLSTACMIPRGISPNGDGDNDSFDLANLNIKEISIFNRYGLEVFHYNSGYTNQWHGQDKNNHDLPDGTYFYTIHKADGSAVTGWVYINREY
jgi:gliding motility-associated-like protein